MKKGLYKKAAQLLVNKGLEHNNDYLYVCNALRCLGISALNFHILFKPYDDCYVYWIGSEDGPTEETQLARSIALLLMHEMERTGDLK